MESMICKDSHFIENPLLDRQPAQTGEYWVTWLNLWVPAQAAESSLKVLVSALILICSDGKQKDNGLTDYLTPYLAQEQC